MFCFKCGKEIREDMMFCIYCGVDLKVMDNSGKMKENLSECDNDNDVNDANGNIAREYYWKGVELAHSDTKRAHMCFTRAAEMGNSGALYALGDYYALGRYVIKDYRQTGVDYVPNKKDLLEAEKYYKLAYNKECFEAKNSLLEMYMNDAIGKYSEKIFGYDVDEVIKEGKEWVKSAIEPKERQCAINFICKWLTIDYDLSVEEVLSFYDELVTIDPKENYKFGELYREGYGFRNEIEPDIQLAAKYMKLAWDAGNVYAGVKLFGIRDANEDALDDKIKEESIDIILECAELYKKHGNMFERPLMDSLLFSSEIYITCAEDVKSEFDEKILQDAIENLSLYLEDMWQFNHITPYEQEKIIVATNMLAVAMEKCDAKDNMLQERFIKKLNSEISNFALSTKVYYIEDIFLGREAVAENRQLVYEILEEKANDIKQSGILLTRTRYILLELYGLHKDKLNEEEIALLQSIFKNKLEEEFDRYFKYLEKTSKDDPDFLDIYNELRKANERELTVEGVVYSSKEEADLAREEIEYIDHIFYDYSLSSPERYRRILSREYNTKQADKLAQKLLKHHRQKLINDSELSTHKEVDNEKVVIAIFSGIFSVGLGVWALSKDSILWKYLGVCWIIGGIYYMIGPIVKNIKSELEARKKIKEYDWEISQINSVCYIENDRIKKR